MKLQCQNSDRISVLPQDTIEKILSLMPIRDALRTSILSKKWRYCWTGIPKLVFYQDMVELSPDSDVEEININKFVKAIFHVLLLHRAPILEFSLLVDGLEMFSEIDQIILHLSRSNTIKRFIFEILGTDSYLLPFSFFSLRGLEHLHLSYCTLELPLMYKGFSMLKSLHFQEVYVTTEMVLGFLTNCPLLETFTWIKEEMELVITECELIELFKCLPSVQYLKISHLCIKHLVVGCMPHPNPEVHLRILVLNVCFLNLSSVLRVISSSPNLEKVKMKMCWNHECQCLQQTFISLIDPHDFSGLSLDHLEELEIIEFRYHSQGMEFVKLIMAKSPVLKKAQIELSKSVSAGNEIKMLRYLLHFPFPRASPTANFIIKRPTNYRELK